MLETNSYRINSASFTEPIGKKDHLAKPYPGGGYDFLLINVNSTFQQGLIPDGEEPPWGLVRVADVARKTYGINAGILDSHRLKLMPEEIKRQLELIRPKIVGLNPTSVNIAEAQSIAAICDFLGIPVILGGVHATLNPAIARRDFPESKAIIRGNGEIVTGLLVKGLLDGNEPPLKGVYYENDDYSRVDFAPKMSANDLPVINQDELIDKPLFRHKVTIGGKPKVINEATLYISQGCPFECSFCASPVMNDRGNPFTKPYDRPNSSRVIEQIQNCIDLGADAIHFLDDMAFTLQRHIQELYYGLAEKQLLGKFIWRGLTRVPVVNHLDEQTMKMLAETGIWKIALGIESGNNDILKRINKGITRDEAFRAVYKLGSEGIQVKGFFIMGFPGETESQIIQTQQFIYLLREVGLTDLAIFQFKPYPGTKEYDFLAKEKPEALLELSYLRQSQTGLKGKAQFRIEQHDSWLPDELTISEIPSGKVREYVMQTISEFYGKEIA